MDGFPALNSKDNDDKEAQKDKDDVSELFRAKEEIKQELIDTKNILLSKIDVEKSNLAIARKELLAIKTTVLSQLVNLQSEKSKLTRERAILSEIQVERSKLAKEKKELHEDKDNILSEFQAEKLKIAQAKKELQEDKDNILSKFQAEKLEIAQARTDFQEECDKIKENFFEAQKGAIKEMEGKIHEFNSMHNSNPPALEKYVKKAKSEIRQVLADTEEQIRQNQQDV